MPVAACFVAGVGLSGWIGACPAAWWAGGLAVLVLSLASGPRLAVIGVCAGFAALGIARAAPGSSDASAPDRPGLQLWEVQVGRRVLRPASSGVPVTLLGARSRGPRGAERAWSGAVDATLHLGAWPGPESPHRGERWVVLGRLRPPSREGQAARLFVARPWHAAPLRAPPPRLRGRLAGAGDVGLEQLRGRVRRAIERSAPGRSEGLLVALALGDRRGVDPTLRAAFARTGTAHLLAISGLHVGCLAGVLLTVTTRIARRLPWSESALLGGRPDRLAPLLALAGGTAYVVLAGAPVSARRALVMLTCLLVARLLDRRVSPWNALGAAALVVAWTDPAAVRSLGFQLSVSSVAGLILLARRPTGGRPRGPRRIVGSVLSMTRASAAATLATAPLCALGFGQVPVAGLWTNLVAIPLLGGATIPSLLSGAALGALHPALGRPFIAVAGLLAEVGCAVVIWFGDPVRCPVITVSPSPAVVGLLYGGAALVAVLLSRPEMAR